MRRPSLRSVKDAIMPELTLLVKFYDMLYFVQCTIKKNGVRNNFVLPVIPILDNQPYSTQQNLYLISYTRFNRKIN